jgi:hypothetical protein
MQMDTSIPLLVKTRMLPKCCPCPGTFYRFFLEIGWGVGLLGEMSGLGAGKAGLPLYNRFIRTSRSC